MGKVIAAFMKKPTTIVGIMTAILFQLIFSVIWMTGYDGVTDVDRMKGLRVGLVVQDGQIGPAIADKLSQSLPVQTEQFASEEEAQEKLDNRELQMVITIPAEFGQSIMTADRTAAIQYTINESNPALIRSMMSTIAAQVTSTLNKEAVGQGVHSVLTQAKMPEEQAAGSAEALSERVVSHLQYTNKVDGMNNQMVPMMMVLASYVGAMIMGMNLEQSSMAVAAQFGRMKRFAARSIINVISAVVVSLIGSALVLSLGGQAEQGFLAMWGFQSLFVLTFMFVSQLFLILFGMAGMVFNIIMLSLQLVSSGAMLPRELLSDFYITIGNYLPATYAVEGNMNLLFGGPNVWSDSIGLIMIMLVAFAISLAVTGLRKGRASQQPVPASTTANANLRT
ncbi:hypothetical protein PAECIP111893_02305 [Paenibacillus plantiphilus]|uniref:ABC-2 type transporter transmembrane domain-containing protein n=1 Tax=Paenibacillus plantiphilus TaxID=2905650 RepID=A0ABM9C8H6_9BACL|nr:ABC transporter permease [Paenibacillus plantiphilus]CAH1205200.1 hypothetical protein PAECIP111893_02305 [Paenibacillus plantiphilus]